MSNFPTSLDDSSSIPNPATTDKTNSPSHAALHGATGDAVKAVEAKIGTGSSTPTTNTILRGTGTGTSAWGSITSAQLLAILSDETGTGLAVFNNTPTLLTPKMDTINESTSTNGVTIDGLNIKDNKLNTNDSVVTANITDSAITSAKVATGMPVQIVSTNYATSSTTTTLIPWDDTIPQITEGAEFMTQVITPKSTTNRLSIEVVIMGSHTAASHITAALFQDANANALAVNAQFGTTSTGENNTKLTYDMVAGTTSSTTFRVRCGSEVAGTFTFNGSAGARKFGGASISNIKITEYKA